MCRRAYLFSVHGNTLLASLNDNTGIDNRSGTDFTITLEDSTEIDIDLGNATKLSEVINILNAADPAKLSAEISADGKGIEITDKTFVSGTFTIESAAGRTTAEDLGITETASGGTITGKQLFSGLKTTLLSSLNGGIGVGVLGDVDLTDRSGATATIDLSNVQTIDDVISAINNSGIGVTASINSSRNGIQIKDTTGLTASNLIIANGDGTNSADALGITFDAAITKSNSGTLERGSISNATPLSALNNGNGVSLKSFIITDSSGENDAVILNTEGSEVTTIGELLDTINGLDISVTASINATGDGIQLVDTANGSGTLNAAESGNNSTAADLGILGTATTVNSQQVLNGTSVQEIQIARSIGLSALNAGSGVDIGEFTITDSNGDSVTIDLSDVGSEEDAVPAVTIGDVIDAINAQSNADVTASLNETGDGILLIDNTSGAGTLTVAELDSGTAAADLGILGTATSLTVNGQSVNGIDTAGSLDSSQVDAAALARVVEEINALNAGISASTFFDGDGQRLSLTSAATGTANALLIDSNDSGYGFNEVSKSRDAVLLFGDLENAAQGVLATSSDNLFSDIITGIDIQVVNDSTDPVTVNVTSSDAALVSSVQGFVTAYNAVRSNLDATTTFDAEALTTGILFGTSAVLRVDTELSDLATNRYFGAGDIKSLQEIGISVDDKGKLSLDQSKLKAVFKDRPDALQEFFTHETNGVAIKFETLIGQLAGNENSLLNSRSNSLNDKVDINLERIENMDLLLEKQRDRLLQQFYRMEEVIAKMQTSLTSIQSIQYIKPIAS